MLNQQVLLANGELLCSCLCGHSWCLHPPSRIWSSLSPKLLRMVVISLPYCSHCVSYSAGKWCISLMMCRLTLTLAIVVFLPHLHPYQASGYSCTVFHHSRTWSMACSLSVWQTHLRTVLLMRFLCSTRQVDRPAASISLLICLAQEGLSLTLTPPRNVNSAPLQTPIPFWGRWTVSTFIAGGILVLCGSILW